MSSLSDVVARREGVSGQRRRKKEVRVSARMIGIGVVATLVLSAGTAIPVAAQEVAASTAPESDEAGLYVITPEAMTATE